MSREAFEIFEWFDRVSIDFVVSVANRSGAMCGSVKWSSKVF